MELAHSVDTVPFCDNHHFWSRLDADAGGQCGC